MIIDDSDISIVVQGPIINESAYNITHETTRLICKQLRKLFPRGEIILSTWKNSKTENIELDKLILNDDPGATWFNYNNHKVLNNCNRLIISTNTGIREASRKYVLKIRSDLFVVSKTFLHYFYKYPYYNEKYKFVKNRIIAFSIYSIKSEQKPPFVMQRPYHISDWAYFGYRTDMESLFSIPIVKEPEFSHWFLNRPKFYHDIFPERTWKMSPEQYITSEFFRKFTKINFTHTADTSNDNVKLSENLIANNFLLLDQRQFCLISLKHMNLQVLFDSILSKNSMLYGSWLQDYHKYSKVPIHFKWLLEKVEIIWHLSRYRIQNNILKFLNMRFNLVIKLLTYFIKRLSKSL